MKNRVLSAIVVAIVVTLLGSCGGGGGGGDTAATSPSADVIAYNAALAAYNANSYASAASAFQSFIADFPASGLLSKAHFYLGKSRYHLGDYPGAIAEFDFVLQHYPSSLLLDNSLLWKGKSQQQLANIDFIAGNVAAAALKFADARATYQQVITGYPASALIGDCRYQIALTYYDEKRYAEALPLFQSVYANYPTASVADGTLYYVARTIHQLAQALTPGYTFAQARSGYVALLTKFPLSTWDDNAQYQIGKTYYDELNYVAAIAEFDKLFATYATPSLADAAMYFRAQSVHSLAQAATPGYTFAQARSGYVALMTQFPLSTWDDNAQYQIGKTYFDESNYVTALAEFAKVFANYAAPSLADATQYYRARSIHALALAATPGYSYAQARTEYGLVATNYPASIFVDNAVFRSALTYHDSTQCTLELAALQAFVAAYPLSTFVAQAQVHISDLILVPPLAHTVCI